MLIPHDGTAVRRETHIFDPDGEVNIILQCPEYSKSSLKRYVPVLSFITNGKRVVMNKPSLPYLNPKMRNT